MKTKTYRVIKMYLKSCLKWPEITLEEPWKSWFYFIDTKFNYIKVNFDAMPAIKFEAK